jgi:hypothetical protein
MTPYPGLTWQSVDLKGRFHGPFATPTADGHLLVKHLQAPGDTRLEALEANLTADSTGIVTLSAAVDGLVIPGPQCDHGGPAERATGSAAAGCCAVRRPGRPESTR